MPQRDPRVDAYIARAAPFARPILTRLRAAVHAAVPEATETIKWGFPHFEHHGILCSMAAFKAHCALVLWKGKLVLGGSARGGAMGQFGRLGSVADLPGPRALAQLLRRAARLNQDGVAVPRPAARPRAAPRPPADLSRALRAAPAAAATFKALSRSGKAEYVDWIIEARRPQTRAARIETAVTWLAEGKSRTWRFQR